MEITTLKLDLIGKILSLNNTSKLFEIENKLNEISTDDCLVAKLNNPIKKKLNVEELKKLQNFKPVVKKNLFKKMDDLKIEEPLEDLINMI